MLLKSKTQAMNKKNHNPYPKFFAMIATSTVVMMILITDLEARK